MPGATHIPIRTCVCCRQRDEQGALVRVARVGGRPRVDGGHRLGGRGAYVHGDCAAKSKVRSELARALRISIDNVEAGAVRQEILELLHGAAAKKRLVREQRLG